MIQIPTYNFLLFILLFYPGVVLSNSKIFPFEFRATGKTSGQILFKELADSSSTAFIIESDFTGEKISVWTLPIPEERKSITFQNHNIISNALINENLVLISQHDFNLSLIIMNSDLEFEIIQLLDLRKGSVKNIESKIIGSIRDDIFLLVDSKLYTYNISLSRLNMVYEDDSVIDSYLISENNHGIEIVLLSEHNLSTKITYIKNSQVLPINNNIILYRENFVINSPDELIISSSDDESNQMIIHTIDLVTFSVIKTYWLNTTIELSHLNIESTGQINLAYIDKQSASYWLIIGNYDNSTSLNENTKTQIPKGFYKPLSLLSSKDYYLGVFTNGLILFDKTGNIIATHEIYLSLRQNQKLRLFNQGNLFYINDGNETIHFELNETPNWFLKNALQQGEKFILPVLFVIVVVILLQLYRHQRRIFREMVDLPGLGFVVFIDKAGHLKLYNRLAAESLKINKTTNKKRFFENYFNDSQYKQISDLIKYSFDSRNNSESRLTMELDNDWREWLCKTIVLRNIAGRFRGVFFTGVDITEQLQRRRLSNWAQIAHDMQTNLSTIKLNAEQIDCEQFPDIIKKKERILHQVKLLILRVRDIVTVGRSDKPDFAKHDAQQICHDVLSEFDDTMFPHINFINDAKSIAFLCDKPKLVRALRNAVENGIKAIGDNDGIVKLSTEKTEGRILFTVKDTGKGMDSETLRKMNIPYFTTAKSSGGSGIGTMIMQHVAELHHGRILISSEIGHGTELTFELPLNPTKRYGITE